MTRPIEPPHLPEGLPSTPRVASVGHLRTIIPDLEFPVPADLLAEVLPFGLTPVVNSEQWVAVRIAVDMLLGKATASKYAWIAREDFEALVPLRSMLIEIPQTAEPFCGGHESAKYLLAPSSKTLASCHPYDGIELLDAWRHGRAPVMTALAWLHHAAQTLDDEHIATVVRIAHEALASGEPAKHVGPLVLNALELATPVVCEWTCWPSPTSEDLSTGPTLFEQLVASMGLTGDVFEVLTDEPIEAEEDADDWLPPDEWPWDPDQ